MNTFKEAVQGYKAWKLKKHGNDKLTAKELKDLRAEFLKERKQTSGNEIDRALREEVAKYRAWKQKRHGTARITESEVDALKKRVEGNVDRKFRSLKEAVLSYKQWKKRQYGNDKISKGEIIKIKEEFYSDLPEEIRLREKVKDLEKKIEKLSKLKEGDAAPVDPNADPNAVPADGTAPAIEGDPNTAEAIPQVDPNAAAAALQAIKDQVEQVIPPTAAGDAGADPAAAVPAIDGQTPEAAPLPESREARIKAIRERLAARAAKLKECDEETPEGEDDPEKIQEGVEAVQAVAKGQFAGLPTDTPDIAPKQNSGSDKNPPSTLDVPSEAQLAKGVGTGAANSPATVWPTKQVVSGKVQESTSFAERYLNEKLSEKKVSFEDVKKALSAGLLG
jgi:hypothetical protein